MGGQTYLQNSQSELKLPSQEVVLTRSERIASLREVLPEQSELYTDKYFLRAKEILEKEGLNPWVKAQIMIRKGPGTVAGIDEAIAIVTKYSDLIAHGGKIFALSDGDSFAPAEPIMMIEGPILDIIGLETMYLGVISAESTKRTDRNDQVDLELVTEKMRQIVACAGDRPVIYMGARHWHFEADQAISQAAFEGGASGCSTDIGAFSVGKEGSGTMPHVLENIFAFYFGKDNAVVEASKAFDRCIDPDVNRVSLIDYRNKEIDDAISTARALGTKLHAVRMDTCGENTAQGALTSPDSSEAEEWRKQGRSLLNADDPDSKYWYGNGVTVTGAFALRTALDESGFKETKIVLSSGFASPDKVMAFVRAEQILGVKLFDYLGVGQLFASRAAKMDIVMVGESSDSMTLVSKTGRGYRPNPRLSEV